MVKIGVARVSYSSRWNFYHCFSFIIIIHKKKEKNYFIRLYQYLLRNEFLFTNRNSEKHFRLILDLTNFQS